MPEGKGISGWRKINIVRLWSRIGKRWFGIEVDGHTIFCRKKHKHTLKNIEIYTHFHRAATAVGK